MAMTPREQHDAMLEELDDETKMGLLRGTPFAKLLEEADPIAYRCSVSDFQPTCGECHREFWADAPDEEAICDDCKEAAKEEEETSDEA